jgi:hypothetical protein
MRATTMRYGISVAWIALAAVVVAGCGGGSGGGPSGGGPPALSEQALAQFESCDDLRDAIVEDARQKLSLQAERLRADGFIGIPGPGMQPQPAPTASPGGGSFEGPSATPRDFTDTNVQVPGVDEADVVETDGTRLYLLHGNVSASQSRERPSACSSPMDAPSSFRRSSIKASSAEPISATSWAHRFPHSEGSSSTLPAARPSPR